MAGSVTSFLSAKWKYLVCVVAPLAILALVFALPLKTVSLQNIETYTEAQVTQQPYVTTESYEVLVPSTGPQNKTETLYESSQSTQSGTYSFQVKADTTVDVNWEGSSGSYPLILRWSRFDSMSPVDPNYGYYPYFPNNYYGSGSGSGKITIKATYPEATTSSVTRTRDVVKYREVSTPVVKTRVVVSTETMSLWSYLFR
jgi:hypothetical protein